MSKIAIGGENIAASVPGREREAESGTRPPTCPLRGCDLSPLSLERRQRFNLASAKTPVGGGIYRSKMQKKRHFVEDVGGSFQKLGVF